MTTIMASIHPEHCNNIISGKKTIEVRKSVPKGGVPFKVYIYQTKSKDTLIEVMQDGDECYGNTYHGKPVFVKTYGEGYFTGGSQKVIGEFVCDYVFEIENKFNAFTVNGGFGLTNEIAKRSCLDFKQIKAYLGTKHGYAWHISGLKIYDKPMELSEFYFPSDRFCKKGLCGQCPKEEMPNEYGE